MLVSEKTSIYFSVELSLREISYVKYVHTLDHSSFVHTYDVKIMHSRDAQCNTGESP